MWEKVVEKKSIRSPKKYSPAKNQKKQTIHNLISKKDTYNNNLLDKTFKFQN